MKRLLTLTLLICFIFSSALSATQKNFQIVNKTNVRQKVIPKFFRPVRNFFKRLFGIRRKEGIIEYVFGVKSVTLNPTELTAVCETDKTKLPNALMVEVLSESSNPEISNVYSFSYSVSGGKIIKEGLSNIATMGEKAKVIWDLSEVPPGTYTITVVAENLCRMCAPTITKEIKVLDCNKTASY